MVVSSQISRPVPVPQTEVVDGKRMMTIDWYNFFTTLWTRTGSAPGVDLATVEAEATAALAASAAAVAAATAAQATATAALAAAAQKLAILQNLADLNNVNAARGNLNIGPATAGWVDPTGAGSRATFNMSLALPVGAAYSQAEVTVIANQVIVLQKALGQLILDEITAKTITH